MLRSSFLAFNATPVAILLLGLALPAQVNAQNGPDAGTGTTRGWMQEEPPPSGFGFGDGRTGTQPSAADPAETAPINGGMQVITDTIESLTGPRDRPFATGSGVDGNAVPGKSAESRETGRPADSGGPSIAGVEGGSVTLAAPPLATPGKPIPVSWTGGGGAEDFVTLVQANAPPDRTGPKAPIAAGSPAELTPPPLPGDYEVRYIDGVSGAVLARTDVVVAAAEVSVVAPSRAAPGDSIQVHLVDPLDPADYLTVVPAEAPAETIGTRVTVGSTGPHVVPVPTKPGSYEIRYILHLGPRVYGRAPLEVAPTGRAEDTVVLSAADTGFIGAEIRVSWRGSLPDQATLILVPAFLPLDVAQALDDENILARQPATAEEGAGETGVTLPLSPGAYDLRLVDGADGAVLAVAPVTVTWAEVTLTAPESVVAGEGFEVSWSPQVNGTDRLVLVPTDAPADAIAIGDQAAAAGDGGPVRLLAPAEAGAYELRYLVGHDEAWEILAEKAITVTAPPNTEPPGPPPEAAVALDLPPEAVIGTHIAVGWRGPDQPHDRIALTRPAQPDVSWLWSVLTADGNPATLRMPGDAGTYEIRYVDVTNRKVLARGRIEVVAPSPAAPAPEAAAKPADTSVAEPTETERLVSALDDIASNGTCACTCAMFTRLTETLEQRTLASIGLMRRNPEASAPLRTAITAAQSRASACIRRCQAAFLRCG